MYVHVYLDEITCQLRSARSCRCSTALMRIANFLQVCISKLLPATVFGGLILHVCTYLVDIVAFCAGCDTEWISIKGLYTDIAYVPHHLPPWRSTTAIGEYHLCRRGLC